MGYYPKFGELLNGYLMEQERTAAWLARRLALHHGTVSRWRNGESRPSQPEMIIRIADLLGVYEAAKRHELLVVAGYGYQASSAKGSESSERGEPSSEEADDEPEGDQSKPEFDLSPPLLHLKPPSYMQLVGVEAHLAALREVLSTPDAPWLLSICGLGGIGKTSLASALISEMVKQGTFEKVGWVSTQLSAFHLAGRIRQVANSALTVSALLEELVGQLLEVRGSFSDNEMLSMLYAHLKAQPHLIVIDNLESLPDIERLLPTLRYLAAPSKFLLTSRESLFREPDVYHFSLPELSQSDALNLVRQEAKVRHLPYILECDNEKLLPIYKTVGGNPLALRLIVGQLHILNLSEILEELTEAEGEEAESLYAYIYQRLWLHLDDITRQLFLLMLLVSEKGGTLAYIEQLSQLERKVLRKCLRLLVSLNLVDVQQDFGSFRYSIHRLTRTFLQKQIASQGDNAHLFRTYLSRSLQTLCRDIKEARSSPLTSEWQEQALHSLTHAFKQPSLWALTQELLLALAPRMEQAGGGFEWMTALQEGIEQSQQQADKETEAHLQYHLALLLERQAQFESAYQLLASSAAQFELLGKQLERGRALNRLAYVARRQQRFVEAVQLVQKALSLCQESKVELAYSDFVLGTIAFDQHDWQEAIERFTNSLLLWQETANQRLIASGLTNLGTALRKLERYDDAISTYKKAITLFESIQDPVNQAIARMNLGNVYLKLAQPQNALKLYALAEVIFAKTQSKLLLTRVTFNRAIAYEDLQQWKQAKTTYLSSIAQRKQLGDTTLLLNAMSRLGIVYLKEGSHHQAISTFENALDKLTDVKSQPSYEQLFTLLSEHLHEAREQCRPTATYQ